MLKMREKPDGVGFIYGFYDGTGENIRIDLMPPSTHPEHGHATLWTAYADGEKIGCYNNRSEAEIAVIDYCENQAQD